MRLGDLDSGDVLLTSHEAAARIGVATETWRQYVSNGRAPDPDLRIGPTSLWLAATVDAWDGGRALRRVRDDTHFARVAWVYEQALDRGDSPRDAIAECWDVTSGTAGQWIHEARNVRGVLSPAPGRGKAGGHLTAKGRELLGLRRYSVDDD